MTEHSKNENGASAPQGTENDIIALLKKLQQQMIFLEKKIDLLVGQQQQQPSQPSGERAYERPSFKDKHFSRPPFRPSFGGGGSGPYGRGDRDRGPRSDRGGERGGFSQDRPSYDRPRRDSRSGPGGPPGAGGGFGGPKKPFYRNRKERS